MVMKCSWIHLYSLPLNTNLIATAAEQITRRRWLDLWCGRALRDSQRHPKSISPIHFLPGNLGVCQILKLGLFARCSRVNLLSHLLILPLKIKKWLAFAYDCIFHFRNKDSVIACILRGMQTAFQVGQCTVQHRSAVRRTVKASAGLFGML